MPLTDDLGRYLSGPSIYGREKIVERVYTRLEGCKSRYLSFAGRQVLSQSVLCLIPLYPMQTSILPLVTNESKMCFWLDNWLVSESLKDHLLQEISLTKMYKKVADYWVEGERCNWDMLHGLLPPLIKSKLAAFVLMESDGVEYGICWSKSTSGMFTVSSGYGIVTGHLDNTETNIFLEIGLEVGNSKENLCFPLAFEP
ncbi:hypothetical protein PTKIN_Ptkin11bG0122700 [Pterospermum kingtungense]